MLEVAAVIGRTVPFPLLRAVTGRAEDAVARRPAPAEAAEFLYETRVFPEVEYRFKHALTQDVAYGSVAPSGAPCAARADRRGDRGALAGPARRARGAPRLPRDCAASCGRPPPATPGRPATRPSTARRTARRSRPSSRRSPPSRTCRRAPEALAEAIDIRLLLRSALLQLAELAAIDRAPPRGRDARHRARRPAPARVGVDVHDDHAPLRRRSRPGPRRRRAGARARRGGRRRGAARLRAHAARPRLPRAGRLRRAPSRSSARRSRCSRADSPTSGSGRRCPRRSTRASMAAFCLAELGDFRRGRAARDGGGAAAHRGPRPAVRLRDGPHGARPHRARPGPARQRPRRRSSEALALIEARGIPTWHPWATASRGYALALSGQRRREGAGSSAPSSARCALRFLFGHSQWVTWLAHAHLLAGPTRRGAPARRRGARPEPPARRARLRGVGALRGGRDRRAGGRGAERRGGALRRRARPRDRARHGASRRALPRRDGPPSRLSRAARA